MKGIITIMNTIFLFVAPSGAGKTTIVEALEEKFGLKSIQSYTTRLPRYEGETGHIFISDEEFDSLENKCAYTEFCGNRYCATSEQVDNHDLYVIDPKGVDYLLKHYQGIKDIKVIYIESNVSTRYARIADRGSEYSPKSFSERIQEALSRIENDAVEFYDYIHHNKKVDFIISNNYGDSIDRICDKVYEYIKSVIDDNTVKETAKKE